MYRETIQDCSESGWTGGRIYDALQLHCAKKNRLRSNLYVQRSALSTTGSQLGALTIAAEMCRRESTQHTLAGQRLFRPRLADEKKSSGETTPGLLASACAQRPNPLAEHPNGFFEPAPFERCTPRSQRLQIRRSKTKSGAKFWPPANAPIGSSEGREAQLPDLT